MDGESTVAPDGKARASEGRGRGKPGQKPGERRKPSHREGRKRYIAFALLGRRPTRGELESLIARSCAGKCRFKLTYYEEDRAVVKCFQAEREAIAAAINGLAAVDASVPARTLVASGTIRKAKEAFIRA